MLLEVFLCKLCRNLGTQKEFRKRKEKNKCTKISNLNSNSYLNLNQERKKFAQRIWSHVEYSNPNFHILNDLEK